MPGLSVSAADSAILVSRMAREERFDACRGRSSLSPLSAAVTSRLSGDTNDSVGGLGERLVGEGRTERGGAQLEALSPPGLTVPRESVRDIKLQKIKVICLRKN